MGSDKYGGVRQQRTVLHPSLACYFTFLTTFFMFTFAFLAPQQRKLEQLYTIFPVKVLYVNMVYKYFHTFNTSSATFLLYTNPNLL